jgi:hypothetical protein
LLLPFAAPLLLDIGINIGCDWPGLRLGRREQYGREVEGAFGRVENLGVVEIVMAVE